MNQTTTATQSGGLQSTSMSWAGFGISMANNVIGVMSANASAKAAVETARIRDKAILTSALKSIERINVERTTQYAQLTSALASAQADERKAAGTQKAQIAAYGMTGSSARTLLADTQMKADQQFSTIRQNKDMLDQQLQWKVQDTLNAAKDQFVSGTYHGPTNTQIGMQYLMGTATALVQNYKGDLFKDATAEFNMRFNPPTQAPAVDTSLSGSPDTSAVAGLV